MTQPPSAVDIASLLPPAEELVTYSAEALVNIVQDAQEKAVNGEAIGTVKKGPGEVINIRQLQADGKTRWIVIDPNVPGHSFNDQATLPWPELTED